MIRGRPAFQADRLQWSGMSLPLSDSSRIIAVKGGLVNLDSDRSSTVFGFRDQPAICYMSCSRTRCLSSTIHHGYHPGAMQWAAGCLHRHSPAVMPIPQVVSGHELPRLSVERDGICSTGEHG